MRAFGTRGVEIRGDAEQQCIGRTHTFIELRGDGASNANRLLAHVLASLRAA